MTRTSQKQCNNQTRKHSGVWTILLPLLQVLNSLEVLVFLRIVAIKIDYSSLGWEDR